MASLDEIIGSPLTLEDLSGGESGSVEIKNAPSNINMAAHISLLSDTPEQVESTYRGVSSDLDQSATSQTLDSLASFAKAHNFGKNKQALAEYLADPDVGDAEKHDAAIGTLDVENEMYSLRNSFSTEMLEADSEGESVEAEFVRVSLADAIVEVNQVKGAQQSLLNREASKLNPTAMGAWADGPWK